MVLQCILVQANTGRERWRMHEFEKGKVDYQVDLDWKPSQAPNGVQNRSLWKRESEAEP